MTIYYRGSLSSCNYACPYCPFAKTRNTRAELRADQAALERFGAWIAGQAERVGILVTPWGEALTHRYYRRWMRDLSRLPQVSRVAAQTNLSAPLGELAEADRATLALWTTFHPGQTSLERFLRRCAELDRQGVRYSVGVVGLREHFAAIEELRARLRPAVYLWINAYKREEDYYRPADLARLTAVDPHFHWNTVRYASLGKPCLAGERSVAVDHRGDVRRCHFVGRVLGNLYAGDWPRCLGPRPCPERECGCHIGYIHRPELGLYDLYGDGLLERIPARWP